MVGILALSFLVFHQISDRMQKMTIDPTFERADELQLESARGMYESAGPEALQDYLATLNRIFRGSHFLLDASGVDLVTGENRSSLLPPPPATKSRTGTHGDWHITHRSRGRAVLVRCHQPAGTAAPADVSSLLFPRDWRNRPAVLAGGGGGGLAHPADCLHHRTLRARRSIGARTQRRERTRSGNWGARSIRWRRGWSG